MASSLLFILTRSLLCTTCITTAYLNFNILYVSLKVNHAGTIKFEVFKVEFVNNYFTACVHALAWELYVIVNVCWECTTWFTARGKWCKPRSARPQARINWLIVTTVHHGCHGAHVYWSHWSFNAWCNYAAFLYLHRCYAFPMQHFKAVISLLSMLFC